MNELIRRILEYITKKWRSIVGLFLGIILIVAIVGKLSIPYKPIVTGFVLIIWMSFWVLKTGRLLLPTNKYTVVFCVKTDDKSEKHYSKVIQKLRSEIDNLNVSSTLHFIEIAPDIIKSRLDAERYRETQQVDLVIWGNAYTETADGKIVVNFRLNFTFRISENLKPKLILFAVDLLLFTGTKKWIIDTDNTLYEEIRVANYFKEACLYIIGIYLLTDNRIEDSLEIITALKQIIPSVQDEKFQKLIQGRINSLLVEIYLLLGSEAIQKKDYPNAKKYFLELTKYPINAFRVYVNLAKIEYYLGDLDEAVNYTKKAAKEKRKHPVIYVNYAFFRILGKKYDDALFWYKKIALLSQVDIDIPGLLEFLEERYNENKKEYAYLFALGLLNYRFFDKDRGGADLMKFRAKTKDRQEYVNMNKYAGEVIEAEKYRKKITRRIPGKKR
jgi:tetratricopeptide (TPR) repeat protein